MPPRLRLPRLPTSLPTLRRNNSTLPPPPPTPENRAKILTNLSQTLNRFSSAHQRTVPPATDSTSPSAGAPAAFTPRFGQRPGGPGQGGPGGQGGAQDGGAAYEVSLEDLRPYEQKFGQGTVYAPNDLSLEAYTQSRVQKKAGGVKDPFKLLGIDPRMEYKNYNLLAEFTTTMGRIKHRKLTGLNGVNQRRIAKAIRRAIGTGLLPSTHWHPEILRQRQILELQRGRFK